MLLAKLFLHTASLAFQTFLPSLECLVSEKNQVQLQEQRGSCAAPRITLEGQGNLVSRADLSSWPGTQALCERSSD